MDRRNPKSNAAVQQPVQSSPRSVAATLHLTVQSSSPVLLLCSRLIDAGHDPATPLHVYRGDVLALRVRSIGEAVRLEVNAKGTGFIAHRAVRAGSLAA